MTKHGYTKIARTNADQLIAKLRTGTLARENFSKMGFDRDNYSILSNYEEFSKTTYIRWAARKFVTTECSWFIFTRNWLDSLASLIGPDKRVVEVCADKGILGPLMEARGIDWVCTDLEPGGDHVVQLDAFDSLELLSLQPDVIFASWIPYTSQLDVSLANTLCPLIIVGEHAGGCTGSEEFYDHEAVRTEPQELHSRFEDVLQWDGIHDHTIMINWFVHPLTCGCLRCVESTVEEKRRSHG